MEREPNLSLIEKRSEKFGRNVEIHVIFVRHGEKDETGKLTEEGQRQAEEFGESLESRGAIKGYSSPIQRVVETVERVIKSAPHDKKLKTRIRNYLKPPFSPEFVRKFREQERKGHDTAVEWYLNYGDRKPDTETVSPHEIAESFAYLLTKYLRMTDKLYSGSNIDLVNGTHQGLPEALLKEILKRKIDDKEIIGFEKLEDIGGALRFTEGVEFVIEADGEGSKRLTVNFRGQEYDIDMIKLEELAKSYEEKQKQN